jgi:SAM-dependent methyltransferase
MVKEICEVLQYEKEYQQGYGVVYPETHIIRVHRHILEWELNISGGNILDFGCGTGSHLKYFADHDFTPYGCDTSKTAIEKAKNILPDFNDNIISINPNCDLNEIFQNVKFDIFLSNQVLYYLSNENIANVTKQAYSLLKTGGVFIATMMSYRNDYVRFIEGSNKEFKRVNLNTPRLKRESLINFKTKDELIELFKPFKKLHIGSYSTCIREDEGSSDHWIYVGIK